MNEKEQLEYIQLGIIISEFIKKRTIPVDLDEVKKIIEVHTGMHVDYFDNTHLLILSIMTIINNKEQAKTSRNYESDYDRAMGILR